MRKQTKVVAVASAAALLAIGASMTSFAAAGWVEEDDDMTYWFYFQSNGKRLQKKSDTKETYRTKTINGKKYGFDERGVMVYQWVIQTKSNADPSGSASAADWQYFSSPEDGARMTKGWFKVIPPSEDNTFDSDFTDGDKYNHDGFDYTDADDEDENWYYADSDGILAAGEIKKIKGKYYGFMPDDELEDAASMMSGLVLIQVDENGEVTGVADDGIDADELDDLLDGDYDSYLEEGYTLYYFGDDEDRDGVMRTGSTTINLDGNSYSFYFEKSGGKESKGAGVTGIDDDKYIYKAGVKIKADSDDKYQLVKVTSDEGTDVDLAASGVTVTKIDSTDVRNNKALESDSYRNDDGDTLRYVILDGEGYYLVNTSGTVQKNKTAAKDGDDWYFFVKNYEARLYTNQKELTPDDGVDGTTSKGLLDNWKEWD